MISQGILDIVFGIVSGMFSVLPDIAWSVDSGAMTTFLSFTGVILYIFPYETLVNILYMVISFNVFKITISLVKTIWDVLPLA